MASKKTSAEQRLILAISGASGAAYGISALRLLKACGIETHLVVSRSAALSLGAELDLTLSDVHAMADVVYRPGDVGAAIASGSFRTLGMLVAPCSIKTLGEIASGVTQTLISRAADVCLKERRRLVLMVRESPLHLGHLRAMTAVTEMGAVVAPPVPAFYTRPQSLDDVVAQTVGRALDLFGVDTGIKRWGEGIDTVADNE
jgi:4-hydroxy-3-polyprenylbenzoate decarboxylase